MEIKIDGLICRGDRVAVAFSGGRDSAALFHRLCALEEQLGIEVLALNVEHGIRGDASVEDSLFVKKTCDNARKRLLLYKVDAPARARERKISLETAARELRYECFFRAIDSGACDKIATAHHADDNVESVLLNLLRGSGPAGVKGMENSAYGGRVIRPLLGVKKIEIDAYIAQNQIDYVDDYTNFENDYSRNFIRNEVLPLVKSRFPSADSSLLRFGGIVSQDDEFLTDMAKGLVAVSGGEGRVTVPDDYENKLPVISRAIILAAKAVGLEKDYEYTHVNAVIGLIKTGAGSKIDLPHGYVAVCGYGEIIIFKETLVQPFALPFDVGVFDLPQGRLTVERVVIEKENIGKAAFFAQKQQDGVLFVDEKAVPQGAVIRNRREGDVICKFGGGTKSLKDFLIDKKIERHVRDCLPVCAVGSNVLFVAGVEISSAAAVRGECAYKITYEKQSEEK
ncbi:MAG: tRNA lysidine(34) synthetase TilS [Clostridia bacterium]|nr:tRNA lysidine(34) synthetase TilS [Clostridia bacterium]